MPMAYYKACVVWLINKDKTLGPIQLNGLLKYKGEKFGSGTESKQNQRHPDSFNTVLKIKHIK